MKTYTLIRIAMNYINRDYINRDYNYVEGLFKRNYNHDINHDKLSRPLNMRRIDISISPGYP